LAASRAERRRRRARLIVRTTNAAVLQCI